MEITAIIVMSVLTEAIITYINTVFMKKEMKWQMLAAVLFSIAVCVLYGLDIPASVGVKSSVPYVGSVITGILVSRGSNYIYDLFKKLNGKSSDDITLTETVGSDGSRGVMI